MQAVPLLRRGAGTLAGAEDEVGLGIHARDYNAPPCRMYPRVRPCGERECGAGRRSNEGRRREPPRRPDANRGKPDVPRKAREPNRAVSGGEASAKEKSRAEASGAMLSLADRVGLAKQGRAA